MRIWSRTRQAGRCISVSVIAGIVVVLSGLSAIPVPQLTASAAGSLPIALFLPVLVAMAIAHSLSRTTSESEAVSVRSINSLDTALAMLAVGSFTVIVGVASIAWEGKQPLGLEAIRNTVGFFGLVLIARHWFTPEVAAVPAVLWALAASVVGAGQDHIPRWWAWPIAGSTGSSWIFVTILALVGVTAASTHTGQAQMFKTPRLHN